MTNQHPPAGDMDTSAAPAFASRNQQFYHRNGTPAHFDIDEELGQLILACDKALDFIHRGPIFGAPQKIIDELYDVRVVQLIPKLRTLIENRVTVQWPYSKLVDNHFASRNDLSPVKEGYGSLDKFRCSASRMSDNIEKLTAIAEDYHPSSKEPINAGAVINELATITAHMQQIMVLFGWTWDDVKLASRKQISESSHHGD